MKNLKQILQLVVRHSYKFSQKLEIGMMILIFKVSCQNAMLVTKLSFKTRWHLAGGKIAKKIYLLFTAMLKTEVSVVLFHVSVCDVLGMSVCCLYWQMV